MTTIALLFVGQFLVVADLRMGTVDVIPDPIGWAISAVALLRLRHHNSLFGWAAGLIVLAGVLSVVDWVYPLSNFSPIRSDSVVSLLELGDLLNVEAIYNLLILAIVELTALGLRFTATKAGDPRAAHQFTAVAVALVAVELLAMVAAALVIVGVLPLSVPTMLAIFTVAALCVHAAWLLVLYMHREAAWGHHALTPAELGDRTGPAADHPASA